jgi:F-type H+-transporting ATPase subunit epsilon
MFRLSIVSPERILYEDDVQSLIVPGSEGYLGILSNHAPLISALKVGSVRIKGKDNTERVLAVTGGFIEVSNNTATILADAIEFVEEIDLERAKSALQKAQELLNLDITEEERVRAKHSRQKALNRIKLYEERP